MSFGDAGCPGLGQAGLRVHNQKERGLFVAHNLKAAGSNPAPATKFLALVIIPAEAAYWFR